jgi:hypothetical protein
MIYSKSFLKRARRSKQTTFEPSAVLPDDEGRVFVTDVPGAPVRVIGRLGRDGKSIGIEEVGTEARIEEAAERGIIVLRDEPVAEQIIRQVIRRLLSQPGLVFSDDGGEGGVLSRDYQLFLARLRTSRFKDEETLQHHLDAAVATYAARTGRRTSCPHEQKDLPMTTKSSLAERLMRGILVERGEDGRLRAEGMTDYSEHFRIEQDPDGTWRVTDGAGEMFHGLPDEPTAWLMANYACATATKPMKGETPEETKARIDSTISIKRKIRPMTEPDVTDLPLLYLFERDHEIERQEGFLLAGVLAIAPIITEAEFKKVTLSIIQSLLQMLQAGELQLQTEGWMKGMAPPGDDLTEEQVNAIRAWSLKTRRVNVRVDDVGRVRLQ